MAVVEAGVAVVVPDVEAIVVLVGASTKTKQIQFLHDSFDLEDEIELFLPQD